MQRLLFISHDHKDQHLALGLQKVIEYVTARTVKVFVSSDPTGRSSVEFGSEWFQDTMMKLGGSDEFVCILTKNSILRPWIVFESGFARCNKDKTNSAALLVGLAPSDLREHPLSYFRSVSPTKEEVGALITGIAERADLRPAPAATAEAVRQFMEVMEMQRTLRLSREEAAALDAYRILISRSRTTGGILGLLVDNDCVEDRFILDWMKEHHSFEPGLAHLRHVLFELAKSELIVVSGKNIKIKTLGRLVFDNIMNWESRPDPVEGELKSLRKLACGMEFISYIIGSLEKEGSMSYNVLEGIVRGESSSMAKDLVTKTFNQVFQQLSQSGLVNLDGARVDLTELGRAMSTDMKKQ